MDHEGLINAFNDKFGSIFNVISYKRLDPHSIEVLSTGVTIIFTYYGDKSWKIETK